MSFVYGCLFAPVPFLKRILPSLNSFCIFVNDQLGIYFWGYFSILFHHSITLSVSLKLGKVFPPTQFLFSKIALAVLFLLVFQIKLRRILSISTRNLAGILRGIILDLNINLGRIAIFMMLTLSVHEQSISPFI